MFESAILASVSGRGYGIDNRKTEIFDRPLYFTGLVANRGGRMSQGGHRVLHRVADALGQGQTVLGTRFGIYIRHRVTGGYYHWHSDQQFQRNEHDVPVVGRPPGTGHRHADVRHVFRSAQTVRRTAADQTENCTTAIHRHRFLVDAVHPTDGVRLTLV